MNSVLEKLKGSKIWDNRYNLPIFPSLNNPFLLGAYVWRLLGKPEDMQNEFDVYGEKCLDGKEREGIIIKWNLYYRWPDGSGGRTSHDELIGIAYIIKEGALNILTSLYKNDGIYGFNDTEFDNMYRFIFLEPFLRQCAGMKVSLFSQLKYIAHIAISAFTWKKTSGTSGALMIWLMNDKMQGLPLCKLAIYFYDKIMNSKGCDLKYMINDYFPQEEYKIMKELV